MGFNYQIGSWVLGVEGDGDWANLSGTTFNASCAGVGCTTQSNWLATVRGRAGWAWDRVLFYGTGGAAFANVQAAAGALPFSSTTQAGWTAGVGVEYAIWPNWTAKLEYLFVDLANSTCGVASCSGGVPPGPGVNTTVSLNENVHPRRLQLQIRLVAATVARTSVAKDSMDDVNGGADVRR